MYEDRTLTCRDAVTRHLFGGEQRSRREGPSERPAALPTVGERQARPHGRSRDTTRPSSTPVAIRQAMVPFAPEDRSTRLLQQLLRQGSRGTIEPAAAPVLPRPLRRTAGRAEDGSGSGSSEPQLDVASRPLRCLASLQLMTSPSMSASSAVFLIR